MRSRLMGDFFYYAKKTHASNMMSKATNGMHTVFSSGWLTTSTRSIIKENKKTMYNILIKYNDSKSLWQLYGTSSSTTSNEETFVPFETDDLEKLKTEIKILDEKYGHENIKVVKDVEYAVDINIIDNKE